MNEAIPKAIALAENNKKTFKISKGTTNGAGASTDGSMEAPPGEGVTRWTDTVKQALAMNNLQATDDSVSRVLKQMDTESSGNEKALQGGYEDINTGTPIPSDVYGGVCPWEKECGDTNIGHGLMQTIVTTFAAHKHPGHENAMNGYDNLLASISYMKDRYNFPNDNGRIGNGEGYATGGITNKKQLAWLSENDHKEIIIPEGASPYAKYLTDEAVKMTYGNDVSITKKTAGTPTPTVVESKEAPKETRTTNVLDNTQVVETLKWGFNMMSETIKNASTTKAGSLPFTSGKMFDRV